MLVTFKNASVHRCLGRRGGSGPSGSWFGHVKPIPMPTLSCTHQSLLMQKKKKNDERSKREQIGDNWMVTWLGMLNRAGSSVERGKWKCGRTGQDKIDHSVLVGVFTLVQLEPVWATVAFEQSSLLPFLGERLEHVKRIDYMNINPDYHNGLKGYDCVGWKRNAFVDRTRCTAAWANWQSKMPMQLESLTSCCDIR